MIDQGKTIPGIRTSARGILADYLVAAPRMATWVGLGALWAQRAEEPLIPILLVVIVVLVELIVPLWSWGFTKYALSASGIEQRTGAVSLHALNIAWAAVRAVESSQSWAQRLTGTFTISVKQESELEGHIKVTGATVGFMGDIEHHLASLRGSGALSRVAQEMVMRSSAPPRATSVASPTPAEALPAIDAAEPKILFNAGIHHLVLGALSSGAVVLAAPAALLAALDLLDETPFGDAALGGLSSLPMPLQLSVVFVVGVTGGLLITVMRLYKFRVSESPEGVQIVHGWPGRTTRTIRRVNVTGIIWTANPFEQAVGWTKLKLVTPESGRVGTQGASLPSLPNFIIETILQSASQELLRGAGRSQLVAKRADSRATNLINGLIALSARLLSLAIAALAGWALVGQARLPLWFGILASVGSFWAIGALTRLLSGHFEYGGGLLVHRSRFPSIRVTCQSIRSIQGFSAIQLFRDPAPTALISVASFAGGKLSLRSLCSDRAWLDDAVRDRVSIDERSDYSTSGASSRSGFHIDQIHEESSD